MSQLGKKNINPAVVENLYTLENRFKQSVK